MMRLRFALAAVVAASLPAAAARGDISPAPPLTVPSGYTATAVAGTPDRLVSLGFDTDGSLLAGSMPSGDPCVWASVPGRVYRQEANGSFDSPFPPDANMGAPADFLIGTGFTFDGGPLGSASWLRTLYVLHSECPGDLTRLDPTRWTGVGYGGGYSPMGGDFGPDGWLYVVDQSPWDTGGAGGEIYKYSPLGSSATPVYEGAPFENPVSAQFGRGAYGTDLWISDNGREGPLGLDDGSIIRFDVATNAYTVFPGRPGDHFWRLTFAPPGPFGGALYVIDNPKHELDTVSPTGVIRPFATWSGGTVLDDVAASSDGQSLYVLMGNDATGASQIYRIAPAAPVDTTPPAIACGTSDGLWHADNVSIACTATDTGSGLANPADASFTLWTSVPAGSATADASTGTRVVCDVAGNCATAGPVGGIMIDRAPPTLRLPADIVTGDRVVTFSATADDLDEAGLPVSCSPASGSHFPFGATTVTCSVTDHAGNVATGGFTVTVDPLLTLRRAINALGRAQLKAHVRNLGQVGGNGYCAQLAVIAKELARIVPVNASVDDAEAATTALQSEATCGP